MLTCVMLCWAGVDFCATSRLVPGLCCDELERVQWRCGALCCVVSEVL